MSSRRPASAAGNRRGAETTAQDYLCLLQELGIDVFIGNLGSDAPSIIDAFARRHAEGDHLPKPVQAPHEMCAVSMAHGYYLASGRPAAVMVHSSVGTANALTGVINASRHQVPLILTAGRTSAFEDHGPTSRIIEPHWAQEAADQGAIVRPYVKWDYELRHPRQLASAVRRAVAIAMSEPRGPVYLSLPMDVMAEPPAPRESHQPPWQEVAATPPHPDPKALDNVFDLLARAQHPLVITRGLGRRPEAVGDLVRLAEALSLPVVEFQVPDQVNFPSDHPLHLGYDPNPFLPQADVILVIDCPVPWVPVLQKPRQETKVLHIGSDPLHQRIPLWGFQCDLALTSDSAVALRLLAEKVRRSPSRGTTPGPSPRDRRRRRQRLETQHDTQRRQWDREVREHGQRSVSTPQWVSHCLSKVVDQRCLVVQEYDLKLAHARFKIPGSYFGFSPAGGLGFGVGGALGVQLAHPDKTVIAVLGEGTYLLGVPSACHMMAAAYDLPILWILTNNRGWGAVKLQTQISHPQGWAQRTGHFPMIRFDSDPSYEHFVRACGGSGEFVDRPQDLPGALQRALGVVRNQRRQVLLNVDCGEPDFSL